MSKRHKAFEKIGSDERRKQVSAKHLLDCPECGTELQWRPYHETEVGVDITGDCQECKTAWRLTITCEETVVANPPEQAGERGSDVK